MKFFWLIIIATIFTLEVIAQCYNNSSKSNKQIVAQRDKEIELFRNSQEAITRRNQRDDTIANITASSEAKNKRNLIALASSDAKTRQMYDQNIRQDAAAKSAVLAEYDAWEKSEIEKIEEKYNKLEFYSANGSFLANAVNWVYGALASLLAVVLAFIAAKYSGGWKWSCLGLSILAQAFASTMAWGGLMEKFNDPFMAGIGVTAFFACIPIAYHVLSVEFYQLPHNVRVGHASVSETVTRTRKINFEVSPEGYVKAITAIARERQLGNGTGLIHLAERNFGVNRGVIHRQIKRVLSGKPVSIPEKLTAKRQTLDSET